MLVAAPGQTAVYVSLATQTSPNKKPNLIPASTNNSIRTTVTSALPSSSNNNHNNNTSNINNSQSYAAFNSAFKKAVNEHSAILNDISQATDIVNLNDGASTDKQVHAEHLSLSESKILTAHLGKSTIQDAMVDRSLHATTTNTSTVDSFKDNSKIITKISISNTRSTLIVENNHTSHSITTKLINNAGKFIDHIFSVKSKLPTASFLKQYAIPPTLTHRLSYDERNIATSSTDSLNKELCLFQPIKMVPITPWKSNRSRALFNHIPKANRPAILTKLKDLKNNYDDVSNIHVNDIKKNNETEGKLNLKIQSTDFIKPRCCNTLSGLHLKQDIFKSQSHYKSAFVLLGSDMQYHKLVSTNNNFNQKIISNKIELKVQKRSEKTSGRVKQTLKKNNTTIKSRSKMNNATSKYSINTRKMAEKKIVKQKTSSEIINKKQNIKSKCISEKNKKKQRSSRKTNNDKPSQEKKHKLNLKNYMINNNDKNKISKNSDQIRISTDNTITVTRKLRKRKYESESVPRPLTPTPANNSISSRLRSKNKIMARRKSQSEWSLTKSKDLLIGTTQEAGRKKTLKKSESEPLNKKAKTIKEKKSITNARMKISSINLSTPPLTRARLKLLKQQDKLYPSIIN